MALRMWGLGRRSIRHIYYASALVLLRSPKILFLLLGKRVRLRSRLRRKGARKTSKESFPNWLYTYLMFLHASRESMTLTQSPNAHNSPPAFPMLLQFSP